MKQQFTAIYKKQGKWYLGWIEEIPGVNTQGESLKEALSLVWDANQNFNKKVGSDIIREPIFLSRR